MTSLKITDNQIINGTLAIEIPQETTYLDLSFCQSLEALSQLPDGLEELNLTWCKKLRNIHKIPTNIKNLNLVNCQSIRTLPQLPDGLKRLNLTWCRKLTTIPNIPTNLKDLSLANCKFLETLPQLPDSLEKLNLRECISLIPTADLVNQLIELEDLGCEVQYPDHFNLNTQTAIAKATLDEIIKNYKQQNQDFSGQNLKDLLHRFLTESIGQRGGIDELITTVSPFLELLKKDNSFLPMFEEIAGASLAGCVNQPVFGMLEISSLVAITQQEGILNKIESAKQLLSLDEIKYFVASNPPGQAIEVEGGNTLFREVYNKLRETNILQQDWLGVAKGVAYESMVEDWLEDNISNAFMQVKESVFDLSQEDIANRICNSHHYANWGQICFPQELEQIKQNIKNIEREKSELQQAYLEIEEELAQESNEEKIKDLAEEKEEAINQLRELKNKSFSTLEQNIHRITLEKLQEAQKSATEEQLEEIPISEIRNAEATSVNESKSREI